MPLAFMATARDSEGFGPALLQEAPRPGSFVLPGESTGQAGQREAGRSRLDPPSEKPSQRVPTEQPEKGARAESAGSKKAVKRRPTEPSVAGASPSGKAKKGKETLSKQSAASPSATKQKRPSAAKPPSKKPPSSSGAKQAPSISKAPALHPAATPKKRPSVAKASPARRSMTSSKPQSVDQRSTALKRSVVSKPPSSKAGKAPSKGTAASRKTGGAPAKEKKRRTSKVPARFKDEGDSDSMTGDDDFSSPAGELADEDARTGRDTTGRQGIYDANDLLYQSQDMASTRYLAGATPGPKYTDASSASKLSKSSSRHAAPTEKNEHEESKGLGPREQHPELIISINKQDEGERIEAVVARQGASPNDSRQRRHDEPDGSRSSGRSRDTGSTKAVRKKGTASRSGAYDGAYDAVSSKKADSKRSRSGGLAQSKSGSRPGSSKKDKESKR